MELSIQSWCFRVWDDHEKLIAATKECGLAAIEQGSRFINPQSNLNYMNTVKRYRQQGVEISSYGVLTFPPNSAVCRQWFEFGQSIGIAAFAADLELNRELETAHLLEPLCDEFGIRIGIHNHGRRHHLGSPFALDRLFQETSENIGLCLDTAWMLDSGYDPVDIADQYIDRLQNVHVKDFVFDQAGQPEDTIVGKGNLRLDALIRVLADRGYAGYLTLEYEGDVEQPVPSCKACVLEMQRSLRRVVGA